MRARREALCGRCGGTLNWHAELEPARWIHTDRPLAIAWNHRAEPEEKDPEETYDFAMDRPFNQIEEN